MYLIVLGLSYILYLSLGQQYRHQADDGPGQDLQPEVRDAASRTNTNKTQPQVVESNKHLTIVIDGLYRTL